MSLTHTPATASPVARWPGYAAGALLLLALLRWSIVNVWDGWCTPAGVVGGVGLVVSAFRQRAAWGRLRSRGARYGGQALASSSLLLLLLGLGNFVADRHNRSFDLTESGLWTLSTQTRQVLRSLPRDIRLLAFFPPGRRAQAGDLLSRYAEASRHLTYELIDPDQEPERAQKYGVTEYGTVVVLPQAALGQPAPSGQPVRVEPEPNQSHALLLSEEKLTNALLKVTRGGTKAIYFVEGHGEADIDSTQPPGYSGIRHLLEGQSFRIMRLNLAHDQAVPGDCSLLVMAGPGVPPLPAEIAAVEKYLERGGKAMLMVDPAPGVGLEKLLDRWGVQVRHDVIMDLSGPGQPYGTGPAIPLVRTYDGRLPIGRDFHLNTFFPIARSVWPKDNPGDAEVLPLAQTSEDSFAQPYSGGPRRRHFDPKLDRKGPIVLAVAVSRSAKQGRQARLVVVGDSDFVSNRFFNEGGNGDFFLRCVNWLDEEEDLIAIQPRPRQDHRVQLSEQEARGIFWLVVIALPLSALGLGFGVQWRRRSG